MGITQADAIQLSKQASTALLQRLHRGGENMPPFPYLSEAEIAAVVAYLDQLAGVPGAEAKQRALKEPPVRVGELIVKSTCHTCHDATGSNPSPQQMVNGAIPPLETLRSRVDEVMFIRKVTHGAPVLMGDVPMFYRGRMPVFDYLSDEDAADAYLYLLLYPPAHLAGSDLNVALSQRQVSTGGDEPPSGRTTPRLNPAAMAEQPANGSNLKVVILLTAMYSFVVILVGGGLGFTLHEFRRLSAQSEARRRGLTKAARRAKRITPSQPEPSRG
jgi:mono/diheme cytochrome c family protein